MISKQGGFHRALFQKGQFYPVTTHLLQLNFKLNYLGPISKVKLTYFLGKIEKLLSQMNWEEQQEPCITCLVTSPENKPLRRSVPLAKTTDSVEEEQ